jgi:hypothetical protein
MVQQGINPFHHAIDVTFIACSAYSSPFGLFCELAGHVQGHHENRNVWRLASNFFCGIQAIHFGHLEIQNDHIGCGLLGSLDRFSTVGGLTADPPGILLFHRRISLLSSTTRIRTGDVFWLTSKTDILKRMTC